MFLQSFCLGPLSTHLIMIFNSLCGLGQFCLGPFFTHLIMMLLVCIGDWQLAGQAQSSWTHSTGLQTGAWSPPVLYSVWNSDTGSAWTPHSQHGLGNYNWWGWNITASQPLLGQLNTGPGCQFWSHSYKWGRSMSMLTKQLPMTDHAIYLLESRVAEQTISNQQPVYICAQLGWLLH